MTPVQDIDYRPSVKLARPAEAGDDGDMSTPRFMFSHEKLAAMGQLGATRTLDAVMNVTPAIAYTVATKLIERIAKQNQIQQGALVGDLREAMRAVLPMLIALFPDIDLVLTEERLPDDPTH